MKQDKWLGSSVQISAEVQIAMFISVDNGDKLSAI